MLFWLTYRQAASWFFAFSPSCAEGGGAKRGASPQGWRDLPSAPRTEMGAPPVGWYGVKW